MSTEPNATHPRQIDGSGGGVGDPEGERSRPPTPFSRPLTARNVAQRPRTTTIFERESDAKRAGAGAGRSNAASRKSTLAANSGCVVGGSELSFTRKGNAPIDLRRLGYSIFDLWY